MRYDSIGQFDSRYLSTNPMPSMVDAVRAATDALESAEYCMKNVLDECCDTLAYGMQKRDEHKAGKLEGWDDTDLAKLDGECQCARRIIKSLGYEVDYWFCSYPSLKPIGDTGQE